MKNLKERDEKLIFNADSRKSDADSRRFIVGTICDYLRYICDHLRSKRLFQKFLKRYRQQIYAFLVLLIIALLQSTLLNYFCIFNVKPNAIFLTLILFIPFFHLRWLVAFAFFGGIFHDLFSIFPFAPNAVIYILWIIFARQISRRLSMENDFIRSALLCFMILLNNLALQSILFILDNPIAMGTFLKIISIESIFTLLLALPIYRFFVHLFEDSDYKPTTTMTKARII